MRRTITISDEAFRRLKAVKRAGETYSEVVLRITGRPRLTDFTGILSARSAEALRKAIDEDRDERRRVDLRRVAGR